jgi:hypothetical protein
MELHYFTETNAALLPMISYSGEAYVSIVMKKTSLIPFLEGKFFQGFTFATTSKSAVSDVPYWHGCAT